MPDLAVTVLEACVRHRDRVALLDALGRPTTFGALRSRVLAVASGLRRRGLEPGDRVLFAVPPSPSSFALALGVVTAGGTLAFADPRAGDAVLAARAAALAPRWALAASPVYALAGRVWRSLGDVTHVYTGPRLPGVPCGAFSWRRVCQRSALTDAQRPYRDFDQGRCGDAGAPALVIPTSGTTAAPRLVVHSRASLGAGLAAFAARVPFGPGDVVHTDQLMIGLPALAGGATWSLPAPGARPSRLARVLRGRGATHTFCVPADVDAVARGGPLPPGVRGILLGAAPVLPGPLRRLRSVAPNADLLAVYGMTELAPAAVATAEEKIAHTDAGAPGDLLGTPLPGVTARVADDGELCFSAPHQALGYLDLGDRSTDTDAECPQRHFAGTPEIASGDLGRVLDDGRIVLTGRRKDMIIRGDRNIYPGLYEAAVTALPGVREALLVGVPTPAGDEHVVLAVAGDRPDAGTVRRVFGVDAPDEVVVLDDLPRGGRSRKPDRGALRALLARR
ncbi:fatty-acyl-CoA synthase [Actinomycetospora sp. NBRC 106375]|uniref:class I adenylate-forming enzyme family protein n=1 Tax=Actinomycetospora sp. NBRC 106375 TaxID=3032207 RepID=UPI0024A3FAFB|nr:class I adenylate-forming enzyme family protein [Actinomycetospora sp. NBRC 106375]GLZ50264.1 fatty-acyl-CoA synthase [Actinomycetospora sp. NBRC 106375]